MKFEIERAETDKPSPAVIASGSALAIFGFCIYYLLPLALLSLNLTLFFNIFFWILIGGWLRAGHVGNWLSVFRLRHVQECSRGSCCSP